MKNRSGMVPALFVAGLVAGGGAFAAGGEGAPKLAEAIRPSQPFFVKNAGQYPPEILYYTDVAGGRLWVREHDLVLSLIEPEPGEQRRARLEVAGDGPSRGGAPSPPFKTSKPPRAIEGLCEYEPRPRRVSNVFITFPGGEFSRIEAEEPRVTKINIFKGNDPDKWVTEIPTFGRVRIGGLAEGADLVLDTDSPGPLWRFEGAEDAVAAAPKPVFDTSAGVSDSRSGDRSHTVRFDTGFGSFAFLWEASPDADRVAAVGGVSGRRTNNLPACGQPPAQAGGQETTPTAQPPEPAAQSLLWGTYIGGSYIDECYALALDSSGNVILGGGTWSNDIPVPGGYDTSYNGEYYDFYVAKLSADGSSLLWGTYIGGSNDEQCWALTLDLSGNLIVGGGTESADIPVPGGYDTNFNGYKDCYIAKLSSDGASLLWGTYIGGNDDDYCSALALDLSGNVIVGGYTWSADIPVPGGYDRSYNTNGDFYVAKLSDPSPTCVLSCTASASPASGQAPLTVAFTGTATTRNCSGSPGFSWDFGDGTTSTEQNSSHTYTAAGTYTWSLAVMAESATCSQRGSVTVSPPVIHSIRNLRDPFRIKANGSNLQNGILVYIDGQLWSNLKWKNDSLVVLRGGASLKAAVPKNTPVQFRFVNPDGGEVTLTWQWH